MPTIFLTSKVISNKKLNDKFHLLLFALEDNQIFDFKPGQFTILKIDSDIYRSYSMASHPSKLPHWQILVDITPCGPGSTFLKNLKSGQVIQHSTAKGIFTLPKKPTYYNIMAATGCGLASIIPMIEDLLLKNKQKVFLFWGLRYKKDLCLLDWLQSLTDNRNFSYQIVLSEPPASWYGTIGHLTTPLVRFASTIPLEKLSAYLCGNQSMITDVKDALQKIIFDKKRVYFERCY